MWLYAVQSLQFSLCRFLHLCVEGLENRRTSPTCWVARSSVCLSFSPWESLLCSPCRRKTELILAVSCLFWLTWTASARQLILHRALAGAFRVARSLWELCCVDFQKSQVHWGPLTVRHRQSFQGLCALVRSFMASRSHSDIIISACWPMELWLIEHYRGATRLQRGVSGVPAIILRLCRPTSH